MSNNNALQSEEANTFKRHIRTHSEFQPSGGKECSTYIYMYYALFVLDRWYSQEQCVKGIYFTLLLDGQLQYISVLQYEYYIQLDITTAWIKCVHVKGTRWIQCAVVLNYGLFVIIILYFLRKALIKWNVSMKSSTRYWSYLILDSFKVTFVSSLYKLSSALLP